MAERLTKAAIKSELTRRIAWFEKAYGFNSEYNLVSDNRNILMMYGRYLALTEQRWQIERGLFVGGFAC
jgi:hypothetical protein